MNHHVGAPGELPVNAEVIEALVRETHRSVDEVTRVYEIEFARLKRDARITDYLVLFAARRTRERLAPDIH